MENNVKRLQNCCYEDLKGDAIAILNLILNAYDHNPIEVSNKSLNISENEFNQRYFRNIDWKSIADVATSAVSRQETHKYLDNVLFTKKDIDEKKLDELAHQHLEDTYPSGINITPTESEIENCINDYKAGYRKAIGG